jgi:hypothetical protein
VCITGRTRARAGRVSPSARCDLPDRKYLRMVDQDFAGSPLDIHIECAIGSLLCLLGCVISADDFEPIRLAQTFHRCTGVAAGLQRKPSVTRAP